MQRNSFPLAWRPKSISDTLDSSTAFSGAMAALTNLIPDPSTMSLWECRPAAIQLTNFPGFNTPGFISCLQIFGTRAYGMIATARNPGQDEPFSYNLLTNTFDTISGVTNANTPASPTTSGAWTPPQMALIGTKIIVTHPGFTGAGGVYFGVIDVSTPTAPAWSGANLTGAIVFTTPPSFVINFNQRAYYLVNPPTGTPSAVFSDVLLPTTVTNASQALTFGDNVPLTAMGGLALFNQLGGIVQSLMVFKSTSNIYQITGDAATPSTLSINTLNITTGTLGPNTVTQTPEGLAFVAPDGLRMIDFNAKVSEPIGIDGQGIVVPFIFSNVPSRMNASASGAVIKLAVQNANAGGTPWQEYWYDLSRKIWSGPHTFAHSMISPYNNTFIITPIGVLGSLWQADIVQSSTSTYVENGQQMTFDYRTPLLPDIDEMVNTCITESTIDIALSASAPAFTAAFFDQSAAQIDSVTVSVSSAPTIWGAFTWGGAPWGGGTIALAPLQLPWHIPLTFSRGYFDLSGQCASGVKLGALHLRYQKLRRLTDVLAAA